MKRVFGVKKEKELPPRPIGDASDRINDRGETVDGKIKKLDVQLNRYKEQIKKTRPGPAQEAVKARAMRVLKQKRVYEGQRDMLYNQTCNLDQVGFASEGIRDAHQTITALKSANVELKGMMRTVKIQDIDYLHDEMVDLMDVNNAIQETLGRSYSVPDDIDEHMGAINMLQAFVSEYAVTGKDAGAGSLLAALAEAGFLIGLEKNRWNPDAIVLNSSQLYGTPSYWVQCFFSESSGATIFNATLQTNSSTSILASVISWKSSENQKTYLRIKIVNFGSNIVNLRIHVDGFQPDSISLSGSTKTLLTSKNVMDENSFNEPNKVIPNPSLLEQAGEEMDVGLPAHSFTSIDLLMASSYIRTGADSFSVSSI